MTISYKLDDDLCFEWDADKAEAVRKKHNVTFQEAATVFWDENGLMILDPDHSEEERFLLMGFSARANILVVSHCFRQSDTVIRLISARKATKREAKTYYQKR